MREWRPKRLSPRQTGASKPGTPPNAWNLARLAQGRLDRMLSYAAVRIRFRGHWPLVAAVLITCYGALLRLDAFTQKYGTLDHPAWARVMTRDVAPVAGHLRPAHVRFARELRPYVGGDPISYLQYAREMASFYQPHVREPMFLATTRAALWALDGQDAAVSLASAIGSIVAIFGTYLLGAALISRWAGVIAAALMAIEYENITWAVDGWRDDLFTGMCVLATWALVRFLDRASIPNALILGVTAGAACLTRITALSFVLPGLLYVALAGAGARRERWIHAAMAALVLVVVVAPYLISCAIATGDPFFSINEHTSYYRFAEGLPSTSRMSAATYVRSKFASRPIATIDVGATGLFARPFEEKWFGFDQWTPVLRVLLSWASLAGLAIWIFSLRGRLMLMILVTSLLPYAVTWNIGSGGQWRFTMHTYPIYILAAMQALVAAVSPAWRSSLRLVVRRAVMIGALAAAALAVYVSLPWFAALEATGKGDAITLPAGARDRVFYRTGWSEPRTDGNVTARVSQQPQTAVHFPLARKRAYDAILRMDPVLPDVQQRVTVLFNRQLIGSLRLAWDPQRVGTYRVTLPADWVRRGENEITLVPEPMVAAGSAGPRFAWIDPATRVGVRFWYLRVLE
jgi:4-amino-4-deoxy-L-arabinose transferase-like glycosyltransferase